jgi:arsenate reductase
MNMTPITIYHNPACGTSRNVLALIRNSGVEPEVIEYLKTPPTKAAARTGGCHWAFPVRDLLRQKGTPYDDLLGRCQVALDDELLDFMVAAPHPDEPPGGGHAAGVKLCRPAKRCWTSCPTRSKAPSPRKTASAVINAEGQRV